MSRRSLGDGWELPWTIKLDPPTSMGSRQIPDNGATLSLCSPILGWLGAGSHLSWLGFLIFWSPWKSLMWDRICCHLRGKGLGGNLQGCQCVHQHTHTHTHTQPHFTVSQTLMLKALLCCNVAVMGSVSSPIRYAAGLANIWMLSISPALPKSYPYI